MGEWTEEIVLAAVSVGGTALLDYLFDLYRQRFEIPADERELAAPPGVSGHVSASASSRRVGA